MPPPDHFIDAPVSLGNFFPLESDEEDEADAQNENGGVAELDNCYEVQDVTLTGRSLKVRQYAYHSHNANRVWPGTFNLSDYLLARTAEDEPVHQLGSVLELGSATGLLAIRLHFSDACSEVVTSDVDDENGDVQDNVRHNFELNGVCIDEQPLHVPHTWGTGWKQSAKLHGGIEAKHFDTIVASDILLYVSAYPALVQTLEELIPAADSDLKQQEQQFIMSWNRRLKESAEFFERMEAANFEHKHLGKCVYRFVRSSTSGSTAPPTDAGKQKPATEPKEQR